MVEWKVKGIYKADAGKVYEEITSLGETFSPEDIVEAARNEKSELHKCFDWRDEVAAQKWRLHTARMLVASIVIRTETADNIPVAVRVIESTSERNTYAPTQMLIKSETEYTDLLARAKAELETFKRKYATVTELQDIFAMIETL